MSDKFLFEELNTLQAHGTIMDKNILFIDNNLNLKLVLRDYQKQAFKGNDDEVSFNLRSTMQIRFEDTEVLRKKLKQQLMEYYQLNRGLI